jgi:hypothetical protein
MPKQREDYTTDEEGWEHHPAFGLARIGRIHSTPGEVLFQSSVRHGEYIEITIYEAARKHDWVHPGRVLVQFALSMSQFASFIASGGTEGVPVTLGWVNGDRPGLNPESRLALTTAEVRNAAREAYADIEEAEAAYEKGLEDKVGAAERRQLLRNLRAAIENAESNVEYAAKKLTEHAETVVETSRADIEAMVAAAQNRQLTIDGPVGSITDGRHD